MTFQIICKSCGSKLNAKEELIGQTRNCPKCKAPVLIQKEEPDQPIVTELPGLSAITSNEPSITEVVMGPKFDDSGNHIEHLPERLAFRNRYFVIGPERIVAVWETGKGWQVNTGGGFSPAKKNIQAIPDQGTFALVELIIAPPEVGFHPTGLHVFKVSMRGALTSLFRDEDEILRKVDCSAELTKSQKASLLAFLRRHFMYEALADAEDVLQYLTSP